MQDRHVEGCIYCGSHGPFIDEHVVSVGLGGDDNGWLLKDVVCGVCDTDVFSKLETKFLRSSGPALGRLFLQDKGRGRGSKASTPSIDAELTYFHEPNSGMLLVARLIAGGRPITLPQIIARSRGAHTETAVTGGDSGAAGKFLAVLDDLLRDDEIALVEKHGDGENIWYSSTQLSWNGRIYAAATPEPTQSIPKRCFWFQERVRPAPADKAAILPSSVFQRPKGQMVRRTTVPRLAVALLSFLRLNPQVRESDVVAGKSEEVERPDIYFRYASDPAIYRRVLVKIGINICASILGAEIVRNRVFDGAVDYARTGEGNVSEAHYLGGLAARVGPRFTRVRLVAGKICGGGYEALFHAQLYGGPVECFRLAEFYQPIPGLSEAVIVLVDYQKHRIEQSTSEAYEALLANAQSPGP